MGQPRDEVQNACYHEVLLTDTSPRTPVSRRKVRAFAMQCPPAHRAAELMRAGDAPRQGQGAIESVELSPPDSLVYRRWVSAQPSGRVWDRWLLFCLVGLAVGLVGFAVHAGIDILSFIKARRARVCCLVEPRVCRRPACDALSDARDAPFLP